MVRQVSSDADVLALTVTGVVEGKNIDFRINEAPRSSDPSQLSSFDPLTGFVGRVERSFEKDATPIARLF